MATMTDRRDPNREVRPGDVVGYRYLIRDDSGHVLAMSTELVHFVQGGTNTLPAHVAERMPGRTEGETFTTSVSEEHAFGSLRPARRVLLPRDRFPQISELSPGQRVAVVLPGGDAVAVWVDAADEKRLRLDVDAPFSGEELLFEISVISIRVATEAELESGSPVEPTSAAELSAGVTGELSTLRDALVERFDDEDSSGGLLEVLDGDSGRNARQVDALRNAHASLLTKLDEIVRRVRGEGEEYDHRPALAALVRDLERHDEEGERLLIDSLNQDVGGEG